MFGCCVAGVGGFRLIDTLINVVFGCGWYFVCGLLVFAAIAWCGLLLGGCCFPWFVIEVFGGWLCLIWLLNGLFPCGLLSLCVGGFVVYWL